MVDEIDSEMVGSETDGNGGVGSGRQDRWRCSGCRGDRRASGRDRRTPGRVQGVQLGTKVGEEFGETI